MSDLSTPSPTAKTSINFQEALNPEQYAAVTAKDGPALILAGAGSGKTRTLTYRVAYLLNQGVQPYQILLLTFTNKAAREMLERVEDLTGVPAYQFWGGTFHHIGQRTLRRHAEHVGLSPSFTILDQGDAEALLADTIRDVDGAFLKSKDNPKPRVLADIISYARNTCQPIEPVVEDRYPFFIDLAARVKAFSDAYREKKRKQNVTDYDDLLEHWLTILETDNEVAEQYQNRFKHILVDEYQDTNLLQAKIIDKLGLHHQIMAVGDDSQCIYTWRGAQIENILNFPEKHPGTQVHKIEINYRSSPEILHFANQILQHQSTDIGYEKNLKPVNPSTQLPCFVPAMDTRQQAQFICKRIRGLIDEGYALSQITILYRAHYQAMDLQMELSRQGIPYTITSGVRFFEQAHVRDLVAQLRFVSNPNDRVAFTRVATLLPKVGPRTAEKLLKLAEKAALKEKKSLIQSLTNASVADKVPAEAKEDWMDFALTLQNIEERLRAPKSDKAEEDLFTLSQTESHNFVPGTPQEIVKLAIDGWYGDYLRHIHTNWASRHDDLESLIAFAERYASMEDLLAQLVLLNSETSDRSADPDTENIRLTTIHQAKGLEYPVVFLIGLAENLFPLKRAIEEGNIEEERRLFYVGVTRAQEQLYITYPMVSLQGGPPQRMDPSRFMQEIPEHTYEVLHVGRATW
ncbi:MAG TPA: DNA helicase UvrD [Opitutae bacterium]|nr:DNA helicase UvrD [Opitutae bacterium]